MVMEPAGRRAFVACSPDNYVAVIDLQTLTMTGKIDAGGEPDGMAWATTPITCTRSTAAADVIRSVSVSPHLASHDLEKPMSLFSSKESAKSEAISVVAQIRAKSGHEDDGP